MSTGRLQVTWSISSLSRSGPSSRLPQGPWLGFKEKRRREESGTGERSRGGRHLLLITHSCGQAAPISAARSCSRREALGRALLLSPTVSRARETPCREKDSPPSIHSLCIGISIIVFIYSPYQQEQPLCLLSPWQ